MAQVVKSPDAFRTISEVSDVLSLEPHVLRFWESKFTQVRPVKRSGGRRYYRAEDVALLAGIKFLLREQGMTIKGAQRLLREKGVRYVSALPPDADAGTDVDADVDMDAGAPPPDAERGGDGPAADVPRRGEVVALDDRRHAMPTAEPADDLALLVADAVRSDQGQEATAAAGGETPSGPERHVGAEGRAAPPPRDPGPPIPLPERLKGDIADDARLRLPARRPRVDPDKVRQNRGAVRRHLASLRDLRSRMDRQPTDAEG